MNCGSHVKLFIVVPVYNRVKIVCQFLEQLTLQTYINFTVIVVDDCSTDGTEERIRKEFSEKLDLVILKTQGNAWWGGGVFLGIKKILELASNKDCVLMMNDDVCFKPDLLSDFIEAHKKKPDAVVSAITLDGNRVIAPGSNFVCWPLALTDRPLGGEQWPNDSFPEFVRVDFNHARACLYPVKIIKAIGNVACRELPHYHGDGEFSYRAVKNGFSSYVSTKIPIFCNTQETGICTALNKNWSLKKVFESFFTMRSTNYLPHRWAFAKLCAPPKWRYFYFVSHVIKSIIRTFGGYFFGAKFQTLRDRLSKKQSGANK